MLHTTHFCCQLAAGIIVHLNIWVMIHHVMANSNKPQEPVYCQRCKDNGVLTEIVFNPSVTRFSKAKNKNVMIPLDKKTKQPHDCPFYKGDKAKGFSNPAPAAKKVKFVKIEDITPETKSASVEAIVISAPEPRTVNKKDGTTALVQDLQIGDDSGAIKLTLWDSDVNKFRVADRIVVENGFVTMFMDNLQLSKGKFGKVRLAAPPAPQKQQEPDVEEISTL